MSQAVWVLHLPPKSDSKVSTGQSIDQQELLAVDHQGNKISSPVKAKIVELKDRKIKLKFQTKKIDGIGLGKRSVWGRLAINNQLSLTDINHQKKDELIFTPKLSSLFLKKGSVVGVAGFITQQELNKDQKINLPVLIIGQKDIKELANNEGKNCLLHVSHNCLLIPENEA